MQLKKISTRIVSISLAIIMILMIVPFSALPVSATQPVELTIGTASALPGATVELNVTLINSPALKSMAVSDITYDTSKMTLTNAEWLCDAEIKNWNSSQGRGVLTFSENTDANGDILKMTFKINDIVTDSDVSVSCSILLKTMDASDNEVPVTVTVIPGKVEIRNEIPGDMDANKKLNSDDAVYLLYHTLFGKDEYPIKQSGDVDGNGRTDSNDAVYLLYYVLFGEEDYPLHESNYYTITYDELKGAVISPDYMKYAEHLGMAELPTLSAEGYNFIGWKDSNGNTVTSISAGTSGNITLKAQWSKETYTITYDVGNGVNSENNPDTYDVETSLTFADPTLKGLAFYRWVDQYGNIVTKIDKGTTGNLELTAEYREIRYTVVPVSQIENPKFKNEIAFGDPDKNNLYRYIYYLGYVTDVPLTDTTGINYQGAGNITSGITVTVATSNSISEGSSNAWSETTSSELTSTITASASVEYSGMKASIEASLSSSLGNEETVSFEESITNTETRSQELAKNHTFAISAEHPRGWYRATLMGTLDMFVAVVYDPIKDETYVEKYSLVRDDIKYVLDYSQTAQFDGHIKEEFDFIIPSEVQDHIDSLTEKTEGLIKREEGTVCAIAAYTGTDKDVVIPTYLDGKKVTSIDANLFAGNTTITSVTFGEGITFIPDGAFEGCTSLKSVVFNGEIKSIGANAFKGCSSLEFKIPDTVTSIGNSAFDGCEAMDSATIAKSVTSLGTVVFNNCGDLELTVNNNDLSLIQTAINSGATSVIIDYLVDDNDGDDNDDIEEKDANCTLIVPAIKMFKFNGNYQKFNNLGITSNSEKTVIENATLSIKVDKESKFYAVPSDALSNSLMLNSSNVILRSLDVTSKETPLVLGAKETYVTVDGIVNLTALEGSPTYGKCGIYGHNMYFSCEDESAADININVDTDVNYNNGILCDGEYQFGNYIRVNVAKPVQDHVHLSREQKVTDSDGVCDTAKFENIDIKDLKEHGYTKAKITVSLMAKEIDKGYQQFWLCFQGTEEKLSNANVFEHGGTSLDTNYGNHTYSFIVYVDDFFNKDRDYEFKIKYGAKGDDNDDWYLGDTEYKILLFK